MFVCDGERATETTLHAKYPPRPSGFFRLESKPTRGLVSVVMTYEERVHTALLLPQEIFRLIKNSIVHGQSGFLPQLLPSLP